MKRANDYKLNWLGKPAADMRAEAAAVKQRTCQECGMLLDNAGEYHPSSFCILKKAGRDPWQEIRTVALQLQLGDPGERPPLVREMHGLA